MSRKQKKQQLKEVFFAAFPKTVPVLAGFLVLGIAYGVLMQTKGYGPEWSVLMSAVAFCGSMQYVAITLLTTAFNPIQAFLMSIMVNARHLFYGLSMLDKFKGAGKLKGVLIYLLCDETFSIECSVDPPDGIDKKYFYFFISVLDYLYWVLGTFLGGILGGFITFNTKGLDFALTALFVVLFMEQWKKKENRTYCIIGLVGTAVSLIIFGEDSFIIPAMIVIMAVLVGGRKKFCI